MKRASPEPARRAADKLITVERVTTNARGEVVAFVLATAASRYRPPYRAKRAKAKP